MNNNKICFITCVHNDRQYEECLLYINNLKIPEGYEIDCISIKEAGNITSAYNAAMNGTDAKYKIYLHQDTYIINKNFIHDILNIFNQNDVIGMMGVAGAKTIPSNAIWWESMHKYGKVYESHTGKMGLLAFNNVEKNYEEVKVIDGLIMVTQYDLPWREDVFDGWHFYDASQSVEFTLAGYKVVVPMQDECWCVHDCGVVNTKNEYEKYRKCFLEVYSKNIDVEDNIKTISSIIKNKKVNEYGINFYDIGANTIIENGCDFIRPEGIKVGSNVRIQKDGCFQLPYNNVSSEPRILIDDFCQVGKRCVISVTNKVFLEKNVLIASNVHITDHNHEYTNIGIPIMYQGVSSFSNEVIIGEGCWIANNVVISGNVKIGRGSTIGANSVVINYIPDYCVAAGSPAKVIKAFDFESGNWIRILDDEHLNEILKRRQSANPILTIGIPTYNRSKYLKKCLDSIFDQVGNNSMIEVLVSDNCSSDDTEELIRIYMNEYTNLTYHRNESNVGAENNILKILEMASGEYVNIHGDDDYFNNGIIYQIMNMIYDNRECSVMYALPNSGGISIKHGEGISEYLKDVSYICTLISGLILRKDRCQKLNAISKYVGSLINQVYVQLELLKDNEKYCILNGNIFRKDSGENLPSGYNFGEVFIKNYFEILNEYADNGLTEKILKNERFIVFNNMILPWIYRITNENIGLKLNDFIEIFSEYYSGEYYFEEALSKIKNILNLK